MTSAGVAPGPAAVVGVRQEDVGVGGRVRDVPRIRDVEVADERGVDPALVGAVRAQRVVDGQDQAGADPDGRGRRGGRVIVGQRQDATAGDEPSASMASSVAKLVGAGVMPVVNWRLEVLDELRAVVVDSVRKSVISSVQVPLRSPAATTAAGSCVERADLGPEVADVAGAAIPIRAGGGGVEDVPGGVVVEDRPDARSRGWWSCRAEDPEVGAADAAGRCWPCPAALVWFGPA